MPKILLGPWDVLYPVRFYSGGDTTRQAFGKHIQEIERIYGLLNALDAGKAGSEEIAEVVRNITHNGLSGLQGGAAGEYWHLTAAQVQKLESAATGGDIIKQHNSLQGLEGGGGGHFYHLSQTQMSNLDALISGGGGGIVEERLWDTGFVRFGNGLMIEWGWSPSDSGSTDAQAANITFPMAFVDTPFVALVATWTQTPGTTNDWWYQAADITSSGMKAIRNTANRNTAVLTQAPWLAIGRWK